MTSQFHFLNVSIYDNCIITPFAAIYIYDLETYISKTLQVAA